MLESLIIGIIASLIAALIFKYFENKSNYISSLYSKPPLELQYTQIESKLSNDERAENRAKLKTIFLSIFFYAHTFFIIYAGLLLPVMFQIAFKKQIIYLSDARFIGQFLPSIQISSDYIQGIFIFIALIIYIPLLLLINKISIPISSILNKFILINIHIWRAIQSLLFALFSVFIAIISFYLFNEITFKDAFITIITFITIIMLFIFSKR